MKKNYKGAACFGNSFNVIRILLNIDETREVLF